MFFEIIKTIIISLILIFLIHYLFLFFKDNLTIPKTKDLVAKPLEKYKTMDTVINNNLNNYNMNNTNINNSNIIGTTSINNSSNSNISGTTSITNLNNDSLNNDSLNSDSLNSDSLNNDFNNNLYKNNNLDMKTELKSFFNQLNNI